MHANKTNEQAEIGSTGLRLSTAAFSKGNHLPASAKEKRSQRWLKRIDRLSYFADLGERQEIPPELSSLT